MVSISNTARLLCSCSVDISALLESQHQLSRFQRKLILELQKNTIGMFSLGKSNSVLFDNRRNHHAYLSHSDSLPHACRFPC